jgi:hypothetical protein
VEIFARLRELAGELMVRLSQQSFEQTAWQIALLKKHEAAAGTDIDAITNAAVIGTKRNIVTSLRSFITLGRAYHILGLEPVLSNILQMESYDGAMLAYSSPFSKFMSLGRRL